jgi:dTDP-4-dehydrorhamnose 3,5-epimerase
VSVDIRPDSSTYGQWVGFYLSAENKRQLWMPSGFAHGFLTLSETADVLYKATDYYAPEFERVIAWNDPKIGINWPLSLPPSLSAKDCSGCLIS